MIGIQYLDTICKEGCRIAVLQKGLSKEQDILILKDIQSYGRRK